MSSFDWSCNWIRERERERLEILWRDTKFLLLLFLLTLLLHLYHFLLISLIPKRNTASFNPNWPPLTPFSWYNRDWESMPIDMYLCPEFYSRFASHLLFCFRFLDVSLFRLLLILSLIPSLDSLHAISWKKRRDHPPLSSLDHVPRLRLRRERSASGWKREKVPRDDCNSPSQRWKYLIKESKTMDITSKSFITQGEREREREIDVKAWDSVLDKID